MGNESIFEKLKEMVDESINAIGEELARLGLSPDKVEEGKQRLKQRVISKWVSDVTLLLHYLTRQEIPFGGSGAPGENAEVVISPGGMDLKEHLTKQERAFFKKAMEMEKGNHAAAARLLKIEPHTFRKRAREKFGLKTS